MSAIGDMMERDIARIRDLEVRLMAARSARRQVEANHERWRKADEAAAHAAGARIAQLEADLRDMTDRYHEASGEADVLRDQMAHAGAYVPATKSRILAEVARAKEAPLPCFANGCSCWKGGGK